MDCVCTTVDERKQWVEALRKLVVGHPCLIADADAAVAIAELQRRTQVAERLAAKLQMTVQTGFKTNADGNKVPCSLDEMEAITQKFKRVTEDADCKRKEEIAAKKQALKARLEFMAASKATAKQDRQDKQDFKDMEEFAKQTKITENADENDEHPGIFVTFSDQENPDFDEKPNGKKKKNTPSTASGDGSKGPNAIIDARLAPRTARARSSPPLSPAPRWRRRRPMLLTLSQRPFRARRRRTSTRRPPPRSSTARRRPPRTRAASLR